MHESLCEFPALVEALVVVSFFLDTTDFERYVNAFLCQIALYPMNRNSERFIYLRLDTSWTEDDHRFVKDVISGIKDVQVVGGCEKKDFMQSDRQENSIFIQEQWQRTLSGDTLFVANIAKLIHEVAHLIAAKLVCYANSIPYTPEQNTPFRLGTKRENPTQGDAGYFFEELLFGGRIIPEDKILILEAEDYYSAQVEYFSISDEWIINFANDVRNKNFELKSFRIPPTALTALFVPSQQKKKQNTTDKEEEELESYKFARNCLRRSYPKNKSSNLMNYPCMDI